MVSKSSKAVLIVVAATAAGAAALWLLAGIGSADRLTGILGASAGASVGVLVIDRVLCTRRELHGPDAFEQLWLRSRADPQPLPDPPETSRMSRLVRASVGSAGAAHHGLQPLLADIAEARFAAIYGTHPHRDPRAAQRAGAAWEWIRPDRPPPGDRLARGPTAGELTAVLAALEELGSDAERRHG
jgi:hypothetical protein